jgi:hypothetical protein
MAGASPAHSKRLRRLSELRNAEQSKTGSRAAVLMRREQTRFIVCGDDEVGAHRAIRACDVRAADLQENPTKRLGEPSCNSGHSRFVGFDEDGGSRRTVQRAERAIRQSVRQRAKQYYCWMR